MRNDRVRIGLDNPAFRGRLRKAGTMFAETNQPYRTRRSTLTKPIYPRPRLRLPPGERTPAPRLHIIQPQPFIEPARPRQQPSQVLKRTGVRVPKQFSSPRKFVHGLTKIQLGLVGGAAVLFIVGLVISWQTVSINRQATAQVAALGRRVLSPLNDNNAVVPSTTKPTAKEISQYNVAPDDPRYLKIPKLHVDARVLQVGVTKSGALGTPSNVFDTAWYAASAKPGQPGATLIDGHVSSWTTHGVFYGLKDLVPGDGIQIVRGDGAVINYQVVKTQVYGANNVDMQAAVTPITPGKSGLNLITCTGDVIKGTSQFNERIIVFAQQV